VLRFSLFAASREVSFPRRNASREDAKTRRRQGAWVSLFGEGVGGWMRTGTGSRGDAEARRRELWKAGGPVSAW
jgi:hypothetical protein